MCISSTENHKSNDEIELFICPSHIPPIPENLCEDEIYRIMWPRSCISDIISTFIFKPLSDGIKDRDKNALSGLLQQVAVFSAKDNSYTLLKHLYNEVRPDFPGYTETDRQLLKR